MTVRRAQHRFVAGTREAAREIIPLDPDRNRYGVDAARPYWR